MQVSIRTIAAAAVVALLVPVAAVAKDAKIEGPMAVAGAGFFGGELEMAAAEKQRPVHISARGGGYIGVLDLAGDLKVRCGGLGRVQKQRTEAGAVYFCKGRAGQVLVRGSHFKFRGQAGHYRAVFPRGTTGTFNGRFVQCAQGEDGWQCERPERPERPGATEGGRGEVKPAEPKPKTRAEQPAPSDDEEIPSLEELAGMLGADE
jgi:hypothetical protein